MLPRWHIFWGAVFTAIIWFLTPSLNPLYLALIFFSSFLIDFDHYAASVFKTKKYSLRQSFKYHDEMEKIQLKEKKKGIRKKGDFHLFHTIEFHILVALFGLIWVGFFYIFMGMVFHSILDLIDLLKRDVFYRREFFFFNWVRKKLF